MSIPLGLYAIKVPGGGEKVPVYTQEDILVPPRIHITMAAVDPTLSGSAVLKIHRIIENDEDSEEDEEDEHEHDDEEEEEEEEFIIATLQPGTINQQVLNLTVLEDERVYLSTPGNVPIYITGNYGFAEGVDYDSDDDEEEEEGNELLDEYDEDGLARLLADVEDDDDDEDDELDDTEGRIEEIREVLLGRGQKRGAEDDDDDDEEEEEEDYANMIGEDDDEDDDEDNAEEPPKLIPVSKQTKKEKETKKESKKEKAPEPAPAPAPAALSKREEKRQAKKLKTENGTAAASNGANGTANDKKDKKSVQFDSDTKGSTSAPYKFPKDERPKKTLDGGVQVEDYERGTGPITKQGSRVGMRYIGKLQEGGKVFDSNTKGDPFYFTIGKGEVIKGWDVGVKGMQLGGKRKITVPAAMAYGSKSQPGIPANSTLVFEVKMVGLK